jgi:hypothetical protein
MLLAGLLLIFYALAQGAHGRQPLDAETLAVIALGIVLLVVFLFIEGRAAEPIMPLDLFRIGLYKSSAAVATLASMGVFGAIGYLPLYLQGVLGFAASGTGLVLLVLSVGWTAGSLLAGKGINLVGYRLVALVGLALLAMGYFLLIAPQFRLGIVAVTISALVIGVGMGLANLTTLVAAQTAVWPHRIGVATSTLMLFRTFGGAFSVSLMGTVMLGHMQNGLAEIRKANAAVPAELWDKLANPQNLLQPSTRAEIPADLLAQMIPALGDAIWHAFLAGLALMIIGVGVSLCMANCTPATTPRPNGGKDPRSRFQG